MFVISLEGVSELVLLGMAERGLKQYYTFNLKACQRLIVGWNLNSLNISSF